MSRELTTCFSFYPQHWTQRLGHNNYSILNECMNSYLIQLTYILTISSLLLKGHMVQQQFYHLFPLLYMDCYHQHTSIISPLIFKLKQKYILTTIPCSYCPIPLLHCVAKLLQRTLYNTCYLKSLISHSLESSLNLAFTTIPGRVTNDIHSGKIKCWFPSPHPT